MTHPATKAPEPRVHGGLDPDPFRQPAVIPAPALDADDVATLQLFRPVQASAVFDNRIAVVIDRFARAAVAAAGQQDHPALRVDVVHRALQVAAVIAAAAVAPPIAAAHVLHDLDPARPVTAAGGFDVDADPVAALQAVDSDLPALVEHRHVAVEAHFQRSRAAVAVVADEHAAVVGVDVLQGAHQALAAVTARITAGVTTGIAATVTGGAARQQQHRRQRGGSGEDRSQGHGAASVFAGREACAAQGEWAISGRGTVQELQDSIEQPAFVRAQSGRFAAKASRPGWSS